MIFGVLANKLTFRIYHHTFEVCGLDHVKVLQLAAMKGASRPKAFVDGDCVEDGFSDIEISETIDLHFDPCLLAEGITS